MCEFFEILILWGVLAVTKLMNYTWIISRVSIRSGSAGFGPILTFWSRCRDKLFLDS